MATLKDIAALAGVKPSTVSVVLNGKTTRIRVSETTQRQIHEAARQLKYEPNNNARALVTGRSGNIGFILSESVTGGWGNSYFAGQLAGVEQSCRDLGYGLSILRYNLANIDTFVFPSKVRRRSVDGLILVGYAEAAIVSRFQQFGIPCVVIGDDTEIANLVPTVSIDFVAAHLSVLRYAVESGHKRLAWCFQPTRRTDEIVREINLQQGRSPDLQGCHFDTMKLSRQADFAGGEEAFGRWHHMPRETRPTLIFGSEQLIFGFMKAMRKAGCECPRDVSLISDIDTEMCAYSHPPITTLSRDLAHLGVKATELLVNHLDHGAPLTPEQSVVDNRFKLILRDSCGHPAQK